MTRLRKSWILFVIDPAENPQHKYLGKLPWLAILHEYCHIWLLGEISAMSTGRDNWKLKPKQNFPGSCFMCLFPRGDLIYIISL